jgi:PAS domain S-box-containing protein
MHTAPELTLESKHTRLNPVNIIPGGKPVSKDSRVSESLINEDLLKSLIDYSSDIITILAEDGTILFESRSIEKILGYKKEELVGKNAFEFVHKDDSKRVQQKIAEGVSNPGKAVKVQFRFRNRSGSYIYLESVATKFENHPHSGKIVVNSRDITERIIAEKNIQRLSAAVEQSSTTVLITDLDGNIEYVNRKFSELTGYEKEEVIGKNPAFLKSGLTTDDEYTDLWSTILTGKVWEGEFRNRKKNGEVYWERIKITPVVDANDMTTNFIAVKDDITEEKIKDEKLENNLREKELMLKEIHHRVKNNLQIVISLLNLQADTVDDPKLKIQLMISQSRVRSMALIHQFLYKSTDLSGINMEEYLLSISSQLLAMFGDLKDRVVVKVNSEDVYFTIETAVPFGLLINELLTNSLKHGFTNAKHGKITFSLEQHTDGTYSLLYSDNGAGLPLTVVNGHVLGFGMYLVDLLVEQLDGKLEHVPAEGTTYKIDFRGSDYNSRLKHT